MIQSQAVIFTITHIFNTMISPNLRRLQIPIRPRDSFGRHRYSTRFFNNQMMDILRITLIGAIGFVSVVAINQNCPCPANSNCLSNNMCACDSGFIGNCSTAATPLGTTNISATIPSSALSLFQINPMNLNNYIEFTLSICTSQPASLAFYLWGQTGDTSSYNSGNSLGNPQSGTITGCQQLLSPYISFGSQPNGLNDLLILGIQNNGNQPAVITLSVSQQAVIGVFLYYYILFGLVGIVALVIVIGVAVFLYRQRIRRRRGGAFNSQNPTEPSYNDIEHFQTFMPMFRADRLGSDRSVCPICLQQIEAAEVVRRPPCKHAFHTTCIDSWGLKNLSCPVCRADLSKAALETAQRISVVQVDLPLQDDWQEGPYVPVVDEGTVEANYDPTTKKAILDDKYQIRQNML